MYRLFLSIIITGLLTGIPLAAGMAQSSTDTLYFGMEPPGRYPENFIPSDSDWSDHFLQNATFNPAVDEFCFVITNSSFTNPTLWYASRDENGWSDPKEAPFVDFPVWDPFFSPDSSHLYLIRNQDVHMMDNTSGEWGNLQDLGSAVNSPAEEWSASASANGNLYYFSGRSSGEGEGIYKSEFKDGAYQEAERLPPPINTHDDASPYIAPDESYLIFISTDRDGGLGMHDQYISFNTDSGWTAPLNFGPEVNSSGMEFSSFVTADGTYLFYTWRKGWNPQTPSKIRWMKTDIIDSLRQVVFAEP